ncbi:P-loop containing nucleoside triphosphate hydrolase protein [Phlegmacium glaucopus]|nr:P-loop containing nucleoside triphosphate hydrolase protein [Phlegmacium glaucopus]
MSDRQREFRRKKLFDGLCMGKEDLTSYNAKLFLEGFYSEGDPVTCISKVIASKAGLSALKNAMRVDLSVNFFNSHAASVLTYLQAQELKMVNGGDFLRTVLMEIVDPPVFWTAYRESFLKQELDGNAQLSFAWLLHQLCSLPSGGARGYRTIPEMPTILKLLLDSSSAAIRTAGQKIKHVLDTCTSVATTDSKFGPGPGGRHDNDFPDFRKIAILPTTDELSSMERAFIQPSDVLEDPETASKRVAIHLDNQFRLLREDMIYEMREELHVATGKKKGHHRGTKIHQVKVKGLECGEEKKRTKWGLIVAGDTDIPQLKNKTDVKSRKAYLSDHRNIFKHQSLACLIVGKEIVAFPTINRDEDRLAKIPPEIVLQFEGGESTVNALRKLKLGDDVTLIQIDTALFSYEPILKALQQATSLPLSSELLLWKKGDNISLVPDQVADVVQALRNNPQTDLKPLLSTTKTIQLDKSQAASLISGLAQAVSLIQGPPGTGKSFIGALIAKALHGLTSKTILVVCYTNHALDDILEGLLDVGIPPGVMLRLGGKSTARTEQLLLHKQTSGNRTRDQWTIIDRHKQSAEVLYQRLVNAFNEYKSFKLRLPDILDYLEFEHPVFYSAFKVPDPEDGMTRVGAKGRKVSPDYLLSRWQNAQNAGMYDRDVHNSKPEIRKIWNMGYDARRQHFDQWEDDLVQNSIEEFAMAAREYNECQEELMRAQNTSLLSLLRNRRIVGCTTTAAAKYGDEIRTFNPDVLLVEEAGEILESHVLTALGPETSQMILIGDHKQLRPKVNHYLLTVEKGDGYDLNRSLFERLILKDYPHERLTEQHRMRPEISSLIRSLTYPELVDAPKTKNRPDLLGVRDNLMFIHHEHEEDEHSQLSDRRDMASTSSKQNTFEVQMVLKIVRYLGQQGYGTDKLVILTPYLGQLHKLRDALKKDNDPILSDLDSHELVKAGLVNPAEAKLAKKPIRLSTIDNYQGEESDIVIVSLTRSNPGGDIGFMSSPERLNVLLSRARNALIMLGNAETFQKARKGAEQWCKLFTLLGHHIYNGLPVKCERHEDKVAILKKPEDFDLFCPDGGCDAKCGTLLSCGVHKCPSKCHQIQDHSKMTCTENFSSTCDAGHPRAWKCSDGPPKSCAKCEREAKLAKERQEQDLDAQKRRDAEQRAHLARLDALNAEITKEQQAREDERLGQERSRAIKQKEDDLAALIASRAEPTVPAPSVPTPSVPAAQASTLSTLQRMLSGSEIIASVSGMLSRSTGGPDVQTTPDNAPSISPLPPVKTETTNQNPSTNVTTTSPRPFPKLAESPSKKEWLRQKNMEGASNPSIDAIMDMTGLEEVKEKVLNIKTKIDVSLRQNASLKQERFNVVLLGNPGTGKTTVARHYAKFLAAVKVTPGDQFIETTGARLANEGVDAIKKTVEAVVKAGGGTIFVDETYQLTSGNSYGGGAVLDFLLAEMENQVGTIVFILAGYNREMEKFFEHNPGLKSRVPYQFQFADYKDEELMAIFESIVKKIFEGRMKVQDGIHGLYTRILIRRLGRRRGQPGFGNARDLQIAFANTRARQADRLNRERTQGKVPDDFLFSAEDLIGPDPSKAIKDIKAWDKLQSMIGLQAVKDAVHTFFSLIEENFQREISEMEPMEVSLNRVFLGSPGTGKTTVAKLYGEILAGLGLLSNGEVITKNPSDFVGAVLGASEQNTKAILANAVGKVLIIDEAYMLYDGSQSGSGSGSNQFKTTVIDTIVAEVQSVPGEDRCVLLLGYRDQMLEMFQNVNPGLSRRFKIDDAFNFEDFDDAELLRILDLKLKNQDLGATDPAKKVAIEMLSRGRNRPNFGNAGEVENLISEAKARCVKRRQQIPATERTPYIIFEPQDFDPNHKRSENAATNLVKLFEDVVGCDDIVERLRGYQQIAAICKARDLDPRERIPTNFVFTGPPGTGKTTVARKIGQVFYDMGILGSAEVVECSASDLVGQYVGHTGPKTKKLFEKALGKVLFVDEAYRLSQGHFAQEAIDELVGLITHPTFKSKLIIILAGYEEDMNNLMSVNTGISSRFPDQVVFTNMRAGDCLQVVLKELTKKKVRFPELEDESSAVYGEMEALVGDLASLPNWGNARDMMTLSTKMINKALLLDSNTSAEVQLTGAAALEILNEMVADRERRSKIPLKRRAKPTLPEQTFTREPPPPPKISSVEATTVSVAKPEASSRPSTPTSQASRGAATRGRGRGGAVNRQAVQQAQRDPGVSDAIWNELQAAIREKEETERNARKVIDSLEKSIAAHRKNEEIQKAELKKLQQKEAEAKEADERAAILKEREKARLKEQAARRAREKAAAELKARREEERKQQEQEKKAQQKLRELGVCPVGYQWIKMGDGYRCSAGGHFVHASQLGL